MTVRERESERGFIMQLNIKIVAVAYWNVKNSVLIKISLFKT